MRNIAAVLKQTSNMLLIEPSAEGAAYIYDNSNPAHPSVLFDVRQEQKVAVSTTKPLLNVDGYSALFGLVFGDDRYLPFEGTGAISRWTLSFPGDSTTLDTLKSGDNWLLEDIVVTIDYTAADGGEALAEHVRTLRTASSQEGGPVLSPPGPGGSSTTPASATLDFSAPRIIADGGGASVAIAPHPSLPASAEVAITYTNQEGLAETTSPQKWGGKGLVVPIPGAILEANAGRRLTVGYTVDAAGTSTASPTTEVALPAADQADTPSFPTPVVPEVRASSALDRRDAVNGATVTVAPWAFIQKDQAVWLRCLGTKADGTVQDLVLRQPPEGITADEFERGLNLTIPLTYLDELGDFAQLRIALKVSLDGSGVESRATTFPELTVDIPRCTEFTVASEKFSSRYFDIGAALESDFGFVAISEDVGPVRLVFEMGVWELYIPTVDTSGKAVRVCLDARRLAFPGGSNGIYRRFGSYRRAIDSKADAYAALRARFLVNQNTHLAPGRYEGSATIHMIGWQKPVVRESVIVKVDVTVPASGSGSGSNANTGSDSNARSGTGSNANANANANTHADSNSNSNPNPNPSSDPCSNSGPCASATGSRNNQHPSCTTSRRKGRWSPHDHSGQRVYGSAA